jgi:excisionase family DNA binding protein
VSHNPRNSGEKTLTIRDAAKALGLGINATYAAARSGEIPALKIGKRILVSREGLERKLRGE